MKLIACVDLNNGMLFNKRRQSKDRELIEHIYRLIENKDMWITSFSEDLFYDKEYNLFEENINILKEDDYCFVENISPKLFENDINEIIIYNWNRNYPADTYFDISLEEWNLVSELDIKGSSHEKITERIYIKKGENINGGNI